MPLSAGSPPALEALTACVDSLDAAGFAVVGADGAVRSWNLGAHRLVGLPPAAAIGRRLGDIFPSSERRLDDLASVQAAADGVPVVIARPCGARTFLKARAFPFGPDWMVRLEADTSPEAVNDASLVALALSHTRDAIFVADPEGRVTYWNDAATRLLGWTADDLVGRLLIDRFPVDARPEFSKWMRQVLTGEEWSGEYEDWRKDGTRVWVNASVRALKDASGHVVGMVGAGHDVTARRAAEQALAERDALYRAAIETTHDGFWIADGTGRLLDVNDAYARRSGYTRDELLAMTIADLEAVETPEDVAAHVAAIRASGHARFETVHRAKDGTTWPLEITTSYSASQDRLFVFVRDISERREAERALREAEERFRFALVAAHAGAWEWDLATNEVTWSPESYDVHGIARDTPCDFALWKSAVHADDRDRCTRVLEEMFERKANAFRMEYRSAHPVDGTRWVLGMGHVLRDAAGTAVRVFGINMDVTDRYETVHALKASEARLAAAQAAARVGSWSWQPDTDEVWWSDFIYDLFELPRTTQPSLRMLLDILHPDDRAKALARAERMREGTDDFADDLRIVLPDGRLRWIDSRARVVRDAEGRVVRVDGTDQDVTERKRAEEALRESQARLLAAQRAARLGSWSWDLRTNELWWSDTIYDLFGVDRRERPTVDLYLSLLHPDDRARFEAGMAAHTPDDLETFRLDVRVIRPDGELIWLDTRVRLVREDGIVVRAEGTDQDVTERRRSEEALRASEQRLSMAQSAARMGSWSWDPRDNVAWWSDATYELYGVDRSFSRRFEDYLALLHPDDREIVTARMQEGHASQDYTTDLRIMRPDGRMVWVANRVVAIKDESGAVLRIEGVDVDITARKRAEDILTSQNRVLEMIAEGAPLGETLAEVVGMVERQLDGSLCSVFTVDRSQRLRVAAAPSLPATLTSRCDGVPVGPVSGSCGAAAFLGESVIAEDIATHPAWATYKDLPLSHGFHSCLSVPILASGDVSGIERGRVLGTFAVYKREPGPPEPRALVILGVNGAVAHGEQTLASAAHVVRVAIERHLAEEALRASEARFRDVLDASPALISLKDLDGRHLFVNRRVTEYTGMSAQQWVGRTMDEVVPADVAELMVRHERQVIATLRPVQVELTVPNPRNEWRTFLSLFFPLFRPTGEPYATCSVSTDITEQKRAQTQRDLLWNLSPDPMVILDLNGTILQANQATSERFGWKESGYLRHSMFEYVHPDDAPRLVEAQARLMRGETVGGLTLRVCGLEKIYRWVSWNVVPQPGEGTVHAFGRDVTEERRLSEQLQHAQKIEAVGQLAGGIAHDFNNLLTVINGFTALLLGSPALQEPQREPLKAIHDAGDRAAALTAQLLAFSRKAMVEPKVLDLSVLTEQASRMLRRLIGEDIRVETVLGAGLPRVRIDPSQFEQVLMNLVLNARDAMPTGGVLRIETSLVDVTTAEDTADPAPAGRYVQVTVSDTGVGMSADVRARIFDPFFTTKDVGKGTGLGLATVYGIVRQAGGTILVESERGRGATFRVRLPALDVPDASEPGLPGTSPKGSECVLLVEDEEGVRRLARLALEMQGYRVLAAASASEALAMAGSHDGSIDLLVTDVVMPGAGGRQLADELRRHRPDLRVLYMSGYTDDAIVRHGVEANIDAFLQKPFTPLSIARKVREVIDAAPR